MFVAQGGWLRENQLQKHIGCKSWLHGPTWFLVAIFVESSQLLAENMIPTLSQAVSQSRHKYQSYTAVSTQSEYIQRAKWPSTIQYVVQNASH
eukprot:scaffold5662_cov201-Skeletonema_dohrnii-CCMP3373.AAC.2